MKSDLSRNTRTGTVDADKSGTENIFFRLQVIIVDDDSFHTSRVKSDEDEGSL